MSFDRRKFVNTTRWALDERLKGFATGDLVKAVVISGKKIGTYVGRVAVQATGFFNITASQGTVQGISDRSCRRLHKVDGYRYGYGRSPLPGPTKGTSRFLLGLKEQGSPEAEV